MFALARLVSAPGEQSCDRDILVEFLPMQAGAGKFDLRACGGRCVQEPRKPRERNADSAAVGKIDPHRIRVEAPPTRRPAHAMLSECGRGGTRRPLEYAQVRRN